MSSISDTSAWLKFFTEAGIPAGEATNYAIIFTDNRIKTDMLLDLNREYLKDMGITVMGDVIAILKHAKVHSGQLSRQKVLQATPAPAPKHDTPPPPQVTKKSTPATRMLEHYVRKDGPPPSPPSSNSSLSQSLSSRLGVGTKRPLEEDDSTSAKRSSVFNRLGDNSVTSTTTENPKITITMNGKDILTRSPVSSENGSKKSSSVFGRLAFKDDGTDGVASDREPSPGKPLEYQGILKYTSKESIEKVTTAKKLNTSLTGASTAMTMNADTTTGVKSRLGMQKATGNTSCSSAGIFARENIEALKPKKSPKAGSPITATPKAVPTTMSPANPLKVKLSAAGAVKSQPLGRTVVTAAATSSSTPQTGKKYVKKILKVNKKTGEIVSEEKIPLKTDVFSRLGN